MTGIARPITLLLEGDGSVPNNPRLPVLHFAGAFAPGEGDLAVRFEQVFSANGWPAAWRNGIFDHHHFHSTAHEALGIYAGTVTVRLGGECGRDVVLAPGDVVVLPAGVAHRRIACVGRLGVVGAYPQGQSPDLCQPDPRRYAARAAAVARVPMPIADPLCGAAGPMMSHWRA
jgi:uncharacterized protein YjlB